MGEWISVKDRLPEDGVTILVYHLFINHWNESVTGNEARGWCIRMGEKSGSDYVGDEGYLENVSHWMPLPEPPTVENEPS